MKEINIKIICEYKETCNNKLSIQCVNNCAFCKIKNS